MAYSDSFTQKLPSMLLLTVRGLLQNLSDCFALPMENVSFVTKTDGPAQAQQQQEQAGNKPKLPRIQLQPSSLAPRLDNERHFKSLQRDGLFVNIDNSGGANAITRMHLVPVTLVLSMAYKCSSFEDLLEFASTWVGSAISNRMNFTMTYASSALDIQVTLQPEIQFELAQASPDNPTTYDATVSLEVSTYANGTHRDDQDRVQMMHKSVTELEVGLSGVPNPETGQDYSASRIHPNEFEKTR